MHGVRQHILPLKWFQSAWFGFLVYTSSKNTVSTVVSSPATPIPPPRSDYPPCYHPRPPHSIPSHPQLPSPLCWTYLIQWASLWPLVPAGRLWPSLRHSWPSCCWKALHNYHDGNISLRAKISGYKNKCLSWTVFYLNSTWLEMGQTSIGIFLFKAILLTTGCFARANPCPIRRVFNSRASNKSSSAGVPSQSE